MRERLELWGQGLLEGLLEDKKEGQGEKRYCPQGAGHGAHPDLKGVQSSAELRTSFSEVQDLCPPTSGSS